MIACVLKRGGLYTPAHVVRLAAQARQAAPGEAFVCLADVAVPDVDIVPLRHAWPGWWSKVEVFRPGVFEPGTRVLYLDLDTTLVGPLDDLLARAEPFLVLEDFYRPGGIGSGLMRWTAGAQDALYTTFAAEPEAYRRLHPGGDQRYLEAQRPAVTFWQTVVPGQVMSYKVHCRALVPQAARVICFHGQPKPWSPSVTGIAREGVACRSAA